MLTDPFFGNLKEVEDPDLDSVAQEAVLSLLCAGCLFAKFSKDATTAAEVEELPQQVEGYRTATLQAYGERDRFVAQATDKAIRLNRLGLEMCERESDLSVCKGRVEELEDELDDVQKELDARAYTITAGREACAATDRELALLRGELASSSEALATARAQIEAKSKAIAEAEARASSDAKALEMKLKIEAAAEAVEERGRGFFLAKAQILHLYKELDLSEMGAFKKVTPGGLVGPNDPPGFNAEYFLTADNEREKEDINSG